MIKIAKSKTIKLIKLYQIDKNWLIKNNQFDTIYHEHYFYYSLISINNLFKRNGLKIFDVKKLKSDYSNEKLMLIINKNREIANRLNLRGTPAFIIGNKIYPGAMSEKDIKKAIALERKR